jgi:hypothetical protein
LVRFQLQTWNERLKWAILGLHMRVIRCFQGVSCYNYSKILAFVALRCLWVDSHSLISWLGRLLSWVSVRYIYKGVVAQNICAISHQNACPAGLSPTGSHSASCPPKYNLYFNTVLKSLPNLVQSRSYVKCSNIVASEWHLQYFKGAIATTASS